MTISGCNNIPINCYRQSTEHRARDIFHVILFFFKYVFAQRFNRMWRSRLLLPWNPTVMSWVSIISIIMLKKKTWSLVGKLQRSDKKNTIQMSMVKSKAQWVSVQQLTGWGVVGRRSWELECWWWPAACFDIESFQWWLFGTCMEEKWPPWMSWPNAKPPNI